MVGRLGNEAKSCPSCAPKTTRDSSLLMIR